MISSTANAAISWQQEDQFSKTEIKALKRWINNANQGLEKLFGPLNFDYRVHFYRRSSHEPVPWAHTWKSGTYSAHFYVDTRHGWDAFHQDWTATHELTHLLFPYIGDSGRWFAEGFATYMQYQAMYANGQLSWTSATRRMRYNFDYHSRNPRAGNLSVVEQNRRLAHIGGHSRLYWGGAAYFLQVDQRLAKEKNLRLTDIVRRYRQCCFQRWGVDVQDMMRSFDKLSGSKIFTETYRQSVKKPGFPHTRKAMQWLQKHPPALRTP